MEPKLVVGLDLGINNVGWCALRRGDSGVDILAMGTWVFESPLSDETNPGDGMKSKQRGLYRRSRRTLRRRHQRKMALYRLLAEHGFLPTSYEQRASLFCKNRDPDTGKMVDPYHLRARAVKEPLAPFELGRAICHLNQRRGFISPRDLMAQGAFAADPGNDAPDDDADEETRGLKLEIQQTKQAMIGFNTVGGFLADRLDQGEPVRKKKLKNATFAKQKTEDQRRFVRADRQMIEKEFDEIVAFQAPHHPLLTRSLIEKMREIVFSQRLLAADADTRGACVFFPKEHRIPKASLTAQKFIIAQELAHLLVIDTANGSSRPLTATERQKLLEKLIAGTNLEWDEARNELGLAPNFLFSMEPAKYRITVKGKPRTVTQRAGTKKCLQASKTAQTLSKILGPKWEELKDQGQQQLVGEIVSIRDWVHEVKSGRTKPAALRRYELFLAKAYGPNQVRFTETEARELATASLPEGYLNLSLKAVKKILPYLISEREPCQKVKDAGTKLTRGPFVYSEACEAAGLNHTAPVERTGSLDRLPYPTDKQIGHPLVLSSVRGAVRILNTLHREFGKPDEIHIELPRDLAMGAQQRLELEEKQKENAKERKGIMEDLLSIRVKPTNANVRKVLLWKELGGGPLPYEPDVVVSSLKELFEGEIEVDHIVPRSHNYDNSMANLTLCTRSFNTRVKGERTLWEALQHDQATWDRVSAHVRSIRPMPLHKRNRILAKERPEGFTGRHLSATGYISKQVLALAQQMVEQPQNVTVAPGKATADLRRFWGLERLVPNHPEEQALEDAWDRFLRDAEEGKAKLDDAPKTALGKSRSNFLHHALDALVVALADRASLQALTAFYQLVESNSPKIADKAAGKLAKAQAMPDPDLRSKAEKALASAVVVHRPHRRPKGELHKQQPLEAIVQSLQSGPPRGATVVGGYLVRYDHVGKPAQAYPLGSNHHVVIWERTTPNAKGIFEREAEVVPTIEAVRRRNQGEPVIRKHRAEPGWRFVMALCQGDMVELEDGTVGVVTSFSPESRIGAVDMAVWRPFVARKLDRFNPKNPYRLRRIRSTTALAGLKRRIVQNPLGDVVHSEGLPD